MKTKALLTVMLTIAGLMSFCHPQAIELTFTAENIDAYVLLDSIKVMNRTQGGDTVLYYPDTVLVLNYNLGLSEKYPEASHIRICQNYPDPASDHMIVSLFVPEKDKVSLAVSDILGRKIICSDMMLDRGIHVFRLTTGGGNPVVLTARWRGQSDGIIMALPLQFGYNSGARFEYLGPGPSSPELKATEDVHSFPFSIGDELLYIGYAAGLPSGIPDKPQQSRTYTFQFATNIPCPGTPAVEYEGQVYNTIQIFSQCWLKENLNVGEMIPGTIEQSDNGTIEKYCYDNDINNCTIYGGLYQWREMMQYSNQQGTRGICPPGWRLPGDEDWKLLEGSVDSQYRIGDPWWDLTDYRGYDAGKNLKTTSGWIYDGNGTDLFGFSALPGGYRVISGFFNSMGFATHWWTSTGDNSTTLFRILTSEHQKIYRNDAGIKELGFSVRCLKD